MQWVFAPTKDNPGETLYENLQRMMRAIAEEGAQAARVNLRSGSGTRALVRATNDRTADHVIGRTQSLAGYQWTTAAVVQVSHQGLDARESVSLMAAGSSVEGRTHAIRQVATQLRRGRAVLSANLTEGME